MHTTGWKNVTFHHDGTPADDSLVHIEIRPNNIMNGGKLQVPYGALKHLIANQVRNAEVAKLEQASDDELLRLNHAK